MFSPFPRRLFAALLLGLGLSLPVHAEDKVTATHSYVGMRITINGHVRHELLPSGRYDEARGDRESAYQGRYAVNGNHIEYWDDTGFTADGDFVDADTLRHGGRVLRRQPRN